MSMVEESVQSQGGGGRGGAQSVKCYVWNPISNNIANQVQIYIDKAPLVEADC